MHLFVALGEFEIGNQLNLLAMLAGLIADARVGLEMIGKVICNVIRHHHERIDGSGYPEGLKGEAISLESRIVAVADVFDALTSTRSYRKGCTVKEGLDFVQQQAAAGQLDRRCVAELLVVMEGLGDLEAI